MGKQRLDPLKTVSYHCRSCGHRFRAEPESVVSAPEKESHPFIYSATCPECSQTAEQAAWEQNLMIAHANATGPTTDEGIRRCKFNALKHGLRADVATYYPARPGGYPHCNACEWLENRDCIQFGGCLKRAELLLRHQIAFETNDPGKLQQFRARTQAHLQALIDDMILAIAQDGGPRISSPEWYYDKDGGFHLASYTDAKTGEKVQINKIEAHPLLKLLMDFVSKNKMTLEDMGMTPKVQEEQEALRGFLDDDLDEREGVEVFQERMQSSMEKLAKMVGGSIHEPVIVDGEVVDG